MRFTHPLHCAVNLLACLSATALLACCGSNNSSPVGNPLGVPQITSLVPSSIEAGSPAFNLTIYGSNFDSSCKVGWFQGGGPLGTITPTLNSTTQMTVPISARDVAHIGPVGVLMSCIEGGANAQFLITGFPRVEIDEPANDLVWDPVRQVIYLSVPPTVPGGSGIAVLDPVGQKIVSFTPVANNPDVLAISDDSQFLYVGLDDSSSVQRFVLPQMTPDIQYLLTTPGDFPLDIQVAPGAPHTTAVANGIPNSLVAAYGGVTVFDDAVARPTSVPGPLGSFLGSCYCASMQWGSSLTALYSSNSETSNFDFYSLAVNANGVVLSEDYPDVFHDFNGDYYFNIHYVPSTGLIYSDDRTIVNPLNGTVVGSFSIPVGIIDINRMVPDSTLNIAAFLSQINCEYPDGIGGCFGVATYNLNDLSFINSFEMSDIKNVLGAINMIRWGQSGLAFNTDSGQVYLVDISSLLQAGSTHAGLRHTAGQHQAPHNDVKVLTTTMRRRPSTDSSYTK
jgi:hypothetical protein